MKVKYFAWVRERIGKAEETVEPPANVRTINDLIAERDLYTDHGSFVRHVTAVTDSLVDAGTLTRRQQGTIVRAAARSDVGPCRTGSSVITSIFAKYPYFANRSCNATAVFARCAASTPAPLMLNCGARVVPTGSSFSRNGG